jgi:hypothetical protein
MKETKTPASDIKPIAMFLDQGKLITQEFISRDGRILAGHRMIPEAAGFPAWVRQGDVVRGFSEKTVFWFPSADAAHGWVLAQVSGESQPALATASMTNGTQQEEEAA